MKTKHSESVNTEYKIPEEVIESLSQTRQRILNGEIEQENNNYIQKNKKIIFMFTLATLFGIGIGFHPQINSAMKNLVGISSDNAVEIAENNDIPTNINLVSTSNNLEMKLTKFVATKQKYAFDYQFEIKDENLKQLLKKMIKNNTDSLEQMIDFDLKADNLSLDLNKPSFSSSSFYVEGDTFYGSVLSTFSEDNIPVDANLTLAIKQLAWFDEDKINLEDLEKVEEGIFSVKPNPGASLEYNGNWTFPIKYKPITQTKTPKISHIKNLTDVQAISDILQTTLKFKTPLGKKVIEEIDNNEKYYILDLYKNGNKVSDQKTVDFIDSTTGEFQVSINLSSLDKQSIYEVKINEADFSTGEIIKEIGSFEVYNK